MFTRAALSTCGREKSNFQSVPPPTTATTTRLAWSTVLLPLLKGVVKGSVRENVMFSARRLFALLSRPSIIGSP